MMIEPGPVRELANSKLFMERLAELYGQVQVMGAQQSADRQVDPLGRSGATELSIIACTMCALAYAQVRVG